MFKIKKSVMSLILAIALILPSVNLSIAQAAGDIDGWTVTYHGDIDAKVSIDNEIYYSGDGALKVEINTPALGNVYVEVTQQVPVEAGKKYYVGAKVKGENVTRSDLIVNWGTRYNVNQFGSTFDWTNFEYLYRATETGTVTWRITQEGFADGIWMDEAVFIDVETGKNLLKNPGFDGAAGGGGEIVAGSISDENLSNDELYARILKADSFAVSDMNKVLGGFKYIPVYQAKNITIDGNTDDWTDYDSVEMPTLSNQYQVYINDGRLMDVKANCKFCYDDKYLYMLIESEDDIYHYLYGSGQYWQGDSLQMSVSTMDEGYGTEIGLAVNPENGDLDVWGLGKTVTPVQAKGSHEGTHTIYEFAFPWDAKFSGVPEKMKFDILVNDNDGDGRRYCAELSPGISEGKTNSKFPVLEFVPGEKDWYGWIQSRSGTNLISGTDYIFDYFIINKSDEEKEFKVIDPDGKTETVKVQGQTGIKRSTVFNFDEEGEFSAGIQIEADGTTAEATVDATISLPPATEDDAAKAIATLEKQVKELKGLIKKCDNKGIDTPYEDSHLFILEDAIKCISDDTKNGEFERLHYNARVTTRIYNEDKEKLENYLSGKEKPLIPNKYIDSSIRLDDKYFYATVEKPDGTVEEDVVFFHGYGHNLDNYKIENMNSYGGNNTQFEVGPARCMSTYPCWQISNHNNPVATYSYDTTVKKEGNQSFKMVYESKVKAHQYYEMIQNVDTVPGKTYTFSGWVKADNIYGDTFNMFANGWSENVSLIGTFDWQPFEKTFTATANTTTVRLTFQSPCDALWIDDFKFVCADDPETNLLRNGNFEIGDGKLPVFDESSPDLVAAIKKLEVAEENNVYVDFLLSPHYFFDDIVKMYDIPYTGVMFLNYNVNAPVAKQIIEDYIRNILPIIKDYPALKSITLTNEPAFDTKLCGDFYNEDWWNYLRERYNNNIEELNEAYNATYSDFTEVSQQASSATPAHNYDYTIFTQTVFAGWHRWMAEIVKEIAPEIPISIKEFAYLRYQPTNMMAFSMNHEMLDFIDINGCDCYNEMGNGTGPYDKELWYDYMQSIWDLPVIDTENHNLADGSENYNEFAATHVYKDIFNGTVHGRSNAISWILARNADKNSQVRGNIHYRPDALCSASDALNDLNRLTDEVVALREEPKEVAILYSVPSLYNDDSHPQALNQVYGAIINNGRIPRFVVESQLDKFDRYDIIIVPNSYWIKDATLERLAQYIKDGGKVLIAGEECLAKNDKNLDVDADVRKFVFDNSKVIEFMAMRGSTSDDNVERLNSAYRELLKESGKYYAEVIDVETGKNAKDVEYLLGVNESKIIVNIVSHDKVRGNSKTVKLFINGEEITTRLNLQTMKEETGDIELGALEVKTYEIETDNPFFDTYSHWGEEEISELYGKELINGVSPSRFAPEANITRAEFLALVVRACGLAEVNYSGNISDVSADKWYAKTVAAGINAGIIGKDGSFRPEDAITREEMCEMLVAAANKKGIEAEEKTASFTDNSSINDLEVVSKAVSLGLVNGYEDGTFRPDGTSTRAEAAAVINRFVD